MTGSAALILGLSWVWPAPQPRPPCPEEHRSPKCHHQLLMRCYNLILQIKKLRLVASSVSKVAHRSAAECGLNLAPSGPAALALAGSSYRLAGSGLGSRGSGWEVGGDQRGGSLTQD